MTDTAENEATIAGNPMPLDGADERRADVEALLARAREAVTRTRKVIEATRARLGPPPAGQDAPAE